MAMAQKPETLMFFNAQTVDHASKDQGTPADLVYLMQRDAASTIATTQLASPASLLIANIY